MSLLSKIKGQKNKLKETITVVTNESGQRFIEKLNKDHFEKSLCGITPGAYGYVVDYTPDDIPALVVDHLYIGSQDCAQQHVLTKYNIRNVVSLGSKVKLGSKCKRLHIPCLDVPETNIRPVLNKCLPFIRKCVVSKQNVLVHCNAGVSRSASVVIGYLMCYEGAHYDAAHDLLKQKRPKIRPNTGFANMLNQLKPGDLSYLLCAEADLDEIYDSTVAN